MTARSEMQFGFSSIGYPEASLEEMAALGREFGMDFLELRALGMTIDLPHYFAATYGNGPVPRVQPGVRLIASSLQLIGATEETIAAFLGAVEVAVAVGAPYVRIFGGRAWGDAISEATLDEMARVVERCRAALREKSAPCEILIETHSAFSAPSLCLKLSERLQEPLLILWDAHHTWRNAGESPEETWQRIGPWVRHIHFSDSRAKTPGPGHTPAMVGEGEYPVEDLRRLLAEKNYAYGVSLEWERLWHPELVEVRHALQAFRRLFQG